MEIKQMQKATPHLFYGYIIAILAFCILFVVYGLRFSYGVFFKPMSSELNWSSATTSLAFSVSMIMEGIFNIILGGFIDKYGPRIVVTISGILITLGYCLIPTVSSTWQFFLYYGGFIGIGMGGLFAPLVSIIARWFTSRRNLVTGLVISSVGIGILIIAPVANQLIASYDWRTTFLIFGIIILIVTTSCAQFLKRDPSVMNLVPYGEAITANKDNKVPVPGLSLKEAVRTHQFWFAFIILFSYGFCTNSVSIHIVPDAIKLGISAASAAAILATIGGLQIAGRIGLGLAADRVGNRNIFILGFSSFTVLIFWLPSIDVMWAFLIFAPLFGLAQGGMASSQAPLVANLFGLKSIGLLFGSCGFGFTIGAALGPYLTGFLFDTFNNYQIAFTICAVISLITLVIAVFLKPLKNFQPGQSKL